MRITSIQLILNEVLLGKTSSVLRTPFLRENSYEANFSSGIYFINASI